MSTLYYKVFIDTNIYDGANYSFNNGAFTALRTRASRDELELHINSVVEGETKKHIKSDVKKAAKSLLDAVKNQKFAGFRNLSGFQDKLTIPDPKDWVSKAIEEFDKFLLDCHVKRISLNGIDVETVVADYFEQIKPFEPKKPDEFKDAIAVASIIQEIEQRNEDEMYVVISNDNGFREAVKQKVKHWYDVTVYDNLNSFVEVLAKADDRATHLKEFLKSDEGIKYEIEEAIKEAVENASFDIERKSYYCIDESDVINISDIEYETKILDIDDNFATVSVAAKCVVKIWYKYTDEDQSYWDREDQCYLWQMVVELEDTYPISFNMDIKLDISGWLPSVEERQDILFEEYVEMPSTIVLYEDDLLEVEDLTEYPSEDDDDYNICPDCGERYDIENDGGNGFCIKCAPNH